jgi:hypothetical protein
MFRLAFCFAVITSLAFAAGSYADNPPPGTFRDDFNGNTIDTSLWATNNLGWYDAGGGITAWNTAPVTWSEHDGVMEVTGSGDYMPMQMLYQGDPLNSVYNFRVRLNNTGEAGIALSMAPFANMPLRDALRMDITSCSPEDGFNVYQYDGTGLGEIGHVTDQEDFAGMISNNTWYDVTIAISTTSTGTTVGYNIDGIGSGSVNVDPLGSGYLPTIYGRGAWGGNGDVSFDYVQATPGTGQINNGGGPVTPEPMSALMAMQGVGLLLLVRKKFKSLISG